MSSDSNIRVFVFAASTTFIARHDGGERDDEKMMRCSPTMFVLCFRLDTRSASSDDGLAPAKLPLGVNVQQGTSQQTISVLKVYLNNGEFRSVKFGDATDVKVSRPAGPDVLFLLLFSASFLCARNEVSTR